jgi:hypothetical protein
MSGAGDPSPFLLPALAGLAAALSLALLFAAAWMLWRLARWLGRGAAAALGGGGARAATVCAALVVTAVFVPAPFDAAAELVLRLVRVVALDVPDALFQAAQALGVACGAGGPANGKCPDALFRHLPSLWRRPVLALVQDLRLPPLTFVAMLVFSFAFVAMSVGRQRLVERGPGTPEGADSAAYKAAAIALSLAGALYLSVTAIIAIPVFNDRLGNLDEANKILAERMPKAKEERERQVKEMREAAPMEPLPDTALQRAQVNELWRPATGGVAGAGEAAAAASNPATQGAGGDRSSEPRGESGGGGGGGGDGGGSGGRRPPPPPQADTWQMRQYRLLFLQLLDSHAEETAALGRARADYARALDGFPAQADGAARGVASFFEVQNTARVGADHTKQHAAILASSYDLWLAEYVRRLEACRPALRDAEEQARARHAAVEQRISVASRLNVAEASPQEVFGALVPAQAGTRGADRRGFPGACALPIPAVADYLHKRRGPAEALGIFGYAAGWLLSTESAELALVVGLLGFGFFGAISTSFIREFAATSGNTLPPSGWIIPALIRGIAAAMLVFLVVVGGIAVFTQSSTNPKPNAYAVFLACFIAAVFSEDVWEWARRRQSEQFRAAAPVQAGGSGGGGAPAAAVGAATPAAAEP